MKQVSLAARIQLVCDREGGLRAAARVLDIDPGYLSRLRSGTVSIKPGATLLAKLNLKEVIVYVDTRS